MGELTQPPPETDIAAAKENGSELPAGNVHVAVVHITARFVPFLSALSLRSAQGLRQKAAIDAVKRWRKQCWTGPLPS